MYKFEWSKFSKAEYEERNRPWECYLGAVRVGDICIDLLSGGEDEGVRYDFYVANEDTGYGYKDDIPYDFADGGFINADSELTYASFVKLAEKTFAEHIEQLDTAYGYSLKKHAAKPLLLW